MRQFISNLQILRYFVSFLRDNSKTQDLFKMFEYLNRHERFSTLFPGSASVQAFERAPFVQGFPQLEQLREMPEGSFGRALAVHMDEALGVDFTAFDQTPAPNSSIEARERHGEETHDIWHVLTGFGTGPANELGLQGFTMAQTEDITSLTLSTLGVMRCFVAGRDELIPVMEALTEGWRMGRVARPIWGVDWRPYLPWPLDEVRARFGIEPVDGSTLAEIPQKLAA